MGYIGNTPSRIQAAFQGVESKSFNGNGSNQNFTLDRAVANTYDIEVVVNNVQQSPYDGSYSVSGTTLSFSEAPSTGTNNIYVTYRDTPQPSIAPTDGSVTTAKLADGAVTAEKLATGAPAFVSDQNNTSTGYFDLPAGTTAQRPVSPNVGHVRYNTDLGNLEQYTADGWQPIAPPPSVTSVDVTNVNESSDPQTFVISGTSFDNGAVGLLVDANGQNVTPTTSTRNSSSQITIVYSGSDRLDGTTTEPLSVRVNNGTGLSSTLSDAVYVNASPAWVTNADLGTVVVNQPITTITLSATDPEGGAVSYAVTNNALPTGLSLTGADIDGTPDDAGYSAGSPTSVSYLDITASDAQSNTKVKTFSITRKWLDGSTSALAAEDFDSILQFYPNAPSNNYIDGLWFKGVNNGTPYQMFTATHGGGKWMRFARVYRADLQFSSGAYSPFEITSPYGDTVTSSGNTVVPLSAFTATTYGQDIEVMCTLSGGSRGLGQGQLGAIQRGVDMVGQLSGRTYANPAAYGYSSSGNVSTNKSSTNVGGATWQYSADGVNWSNATDLSNSLYGTLGPTIANTSWDWTLAGNNVGGAGGHLDYAENSQNSGWLLHDGSVGGVNKSAAVAYGYLAGVGVIAGDTDWSFAELWFRRNKDWT